MSSLPSSLAWAHPLVREWFVSRFGTPTEPQEQGWPHILAGRTTLISAPTGSGKTLAAFLICIDRLVSKALQGELRDCTEVLYVSPLKALGNDIQKNLEVPLGEILALAAERGLLMPEIRTAVRISGISSPRSAASARISPSGTSRFFWISLPSAFSGETYKTSVQSRSSPCSALLTSRSMQMRNAASVLPEPVGAEMSVVRPARISGQPCS